MHNLGPSSADGVEEGGDLGRRSVSRRRETAGEEEHNLGRRAATKERKSTSGGGGERQEAEQSDSSRHTTPMLKKRSSSSHPTEISPAAKAVRLNLSPLRSVQQEEEAEEEEMSFASSSGSTSSQIHPNNIRQQPSSSSVQASGTTILTSTELSRQFQDPRVDTEELIKTGNQLYLEDKYEEALGYYHRSVLLSPWNTTYRTLYALALLRLARTEDGTKELEAACGFGTVYPNPEARLQYHVSACATARLAGQWRKAFHEADSAIAAGSSFSPQLFMCKVEALLNLHQLEEAELIAEKFPLIAAWLVAPQPQSETYIFGMQPDAYTYFVQAQMEMAMERFDSALTAAEKALEIRPLSKVEALLKKIKSVASFIAKGKDLFESENFSEACQVYGEGLKLHPSNHLLYCNRAACWSELNRLDQAIDDCTQSLTFKANNIKALKIRAAAYSKLGRWKEAVTDYGFLRTKFPKDWELSTSFHVALYKVEKAPVVEKTLRHQVELVLDLNQYETAISSSQGICIVYFDSVGTPDFDELSLALDGLATWYRTIHFLKVVKEKSKEEVFSSEMITVLPLLKVYKLNKEICKVVRPTCRDLDRWTTEYYTISSR